MSQAGHISATSHGRGAGCPRPHASCRLWPGAMASAPPRWRFWDFGSVQFVQDKLSGESLRAHGPGAAFTDVPFIFVLEGGRPAIVGLDGDDEHCALHVVDEKMVNVVTIEEDSETQQEVCKVSLRCGDKPAELLSDLQFEKTQGSGH